MNALFHPREDISMKLYYPQHEGLRHLAKYKETRRYGGFPHCISAVERLGRRRLPCYTEAKISMVSPSATVTMAFFQVRVLPS